MTTKATPINRRHLLKGGGAAGLLSCLSIPAVSTNAKPRIVVVGGGAGGGAFVKAIHHWARDAFDVTLITDQKHYTPPYKLHEFDTQPPNTCATPPVDLVATFERRGVRVINACVTSIATEKKTVHLKGGAVATLAYDVLVAAPGIAFDWDSFGLQNTPDKAAIWSSQAMCKDLNALLEAVPQGGTFGLVAPPGAHRCPPAVYERACYAAHWFKQNNSTAKILIVDEKDQYPMQALFEEAYADYYDGMIEWIPREFHGGILQIDLQANQIKTAAETFEVDAANIIPPQAAPQFLRVSGLAEKGAFCPVLTPSMQSLHAREVYVIGDAAAAGEISKSAVSAVIEARLAAVDILARFLDRQPGEKVALADSCWTIVARDDAISLGGNYTSAGNKFVSNQRFMSVVEDSAELRNKNYTAAIKWPAQLLQHIYG